MRRIAVIGAGASGLPAIKCAVEEGFEVICFEKSNEIGGLWRYKEHPAPGEGTVMKSTVINTSKEMTAYSDFPPPAESPNFMHNTELLEYFRNYAKHFHLADYIRFQHQVLNIDRTEDFDMTGQWKVEFLDMNTNNTSVEKFDGVMVCTGHHTEPYWPAPFHGQDSFTGQVIHSHEYHDHRGYEDKKVIVIGIGNSGADIAVELGKIAKKVYLATRSGSWVTNRVWDHGEPADLVYFNRFFFALEHVIPWVGRNYLIERKLNSRFDHGRFGLRPAHRVLSAHLTINDELPNRIASGRVVIKPNVGAFSGKTVVFEDGSAVDDVDVVIFATGYSFGFPLIEQGKRIPSKENKVRLYLNMYPPSLSPKNTLAVIGLVQPSGSIMPISEMQARLFVAELAGVVKLPNESVMEKEIDKKLKRMESEFVQTRRHTIQVYYNQYMDELADLLGVRPHIFLRWLSDPQLAYALFFNGTVPYQYRLDGHQKWEGAREAILGVEERVFENTRTRRTKETMKSRPGVRYLLNVFKG